MVRTEEERRRLEAENLDLQEFGGNGYAILQSVMMQIPWPAFGVDADGILAMLSDSAQEVFADRVLVIGVSLAEALPEIMAATGDTLSIGEKSYRIIWRKLESNGRLPGSVAFFARRGIMKTIQSLAVVDLVPGTRLAEALLDENGKVLMPAGVELNELVIAQLIRREIDSVVVEIELAEDLAQRELLEKRICFQLDCFVPSRGQK